MSQGVLCQKIRFLGQKLWPVACEHTDKQTDKQTWEWKLSTYRGSAFQASAYDLSGPTIEAQPFKLLPMIWAVQL